MKEIIGVTHLIFPVLGLLLLEYKQWRGSSGLNEFAILRNNYYAAQGLFGCALRPGMISLLSCIPC